jgi:hypothetical protein
METRKNGKEIEEEQGSSYGLEALISENNSLNSNAVSLAALAVLQQQKSLLEEDILKIKETIHWLTLDQQDLIEDQKVATRDREFLNRANQASYLAIDNLQLLQRGLQAEHSQLEYKNTDLETQNRQLELEGTRLGQLKQELGEHNLGLMEDIHLLEDIVAGLEEQARQLLDTAELLRQRNKLLLQQNDEKEPSKEI